MSYLELNNLPTKSTINSLDSFIVDSGVLETITSSGIDDTTFDNGNSFTGRKVPIIKAYFDDTTPSNASLTIMPNEPDSITITMSDNNSKKTAKTMPRAIALGLAKDGSFAFADNGADFVKNNFDFFSNITDEGLEVFERSITGPTLVRQWNGSNETYMGFRVR